MADWRDGTGGQNLAFLMIKFYNSQDFDASTDVTFQLPNGSEVNAHKIILGVSSEVFYSQFFGPLADKSVETVKVEDNIESDAFRRMIESIYNSGNVPDLETNEYMDLLEAANFYLLRDVIDECNKRLCEHVKSLEIQELIDGTHMLSKLSIHDQVYESCRGAILSKLSRVFKKEKWDCISVKVQNKLLEDIEHIEMWKGDAYRILKVLNRLSSLEMNNLFPDRIKKFNFDMKSYFESGEKYHAFILERFKQQIHDPFDGPNMQELNEKLENHLKSIETQDSVLSDLYSLLKGDGLDLDVAFEWDADSYYFKTLEKDGVLWNDQEDREHYWRLLEFARLHQLDNLTDHCYLRLYEVLLHSYPCKLAFHINRASATPGSDELFKLGIHVFVNNSTIGWKWLHEPYVNSTFPDIPEQIQTEIMTMWIKAFKSFNEEAIKTIRDQLKSLDEHGAQVIGMGIQIWCQNHSSNPEEASKKFEMMVGAEIGSITNYSNANGGS